MISPLPELGVRDLQTGAKRFAVLVRPTNVRLLSVLRLRWRWHPGTGVAALRHAAMTSGDGDHRCCVLAIGYSAAERVVLPPSSALTACGARDGRG
jgi:hypothetical protein